MDPVRCCFWMQSNASRLTFLYHFCNTAITYFVYYSLVHDYNILIIKNDRYDLHTKDLYKQIRNVGIFVAIFLKR